MHQAIGTNARSSRTKKARWCWIRPFTQFHGRRHFAEVGTREVRDFVVWPAMERHPAAATHNQGRDPLVFFYDKVLKQPLGGIGSVARAKRPPRLAGVLAQAAILRRCCDIQSVRVLLRHRDLQAARIYRLVPDRGIAGVARASASMSSGT